MLFGVDTRIALALVLAIAPLGCRETRRTSERDPARIVVNAPGSRLIVEVVGDDLVHVELAPTSGNVSPDRPIATTPMVVRESRGTASSREGTRLVSGTLTVEIDDGCISVARGSASRVARLCPSLDASGSKIAIEAQPGANAYGLGQSCIEPGLSNGDWAGRVRAPGGPFGNRMVKFEGGACGDTQIPILYVVGKAPQQFALFLDDVRAQTWSLQGTPWSVTTPSPALRFYIITGPTVASLRESYVALTGRPPVPPRAAFGLWVSEFGYEDWRELDDILAGLRAQHFPVDGFVLDLQWFGACTGVHRAGCEGGEGREDSPMGTLAFDETHFPDPAAKLAALREREGVGIITIEESYVGRALPEHARLAGAGHLVRDASGAPIYLHQIPWWGKGGMIDWTNPAAGDAWHDWKRQPLVALGVVGHWTDLGEPEQFDPAARYAGVPGIGTDHAGVHNLYNLAWAASITRGYTRNPTRQRPFILTRSGTAGIQRHGAAMWSGDIAARFTSLASQQRNQLNMSMSGIDYYGSDVGGFERAAAQGLDVDELYTQWFADAALTEVPLRPHTLNLSEKHETSPDRIGHRDSNLAVLRLRYALVPYLYSLAHRAYRAGEPVVPPLFYGYPDDPTVRTIGDEKLVGRDLLVALAATAGQRDRRVYLPRGTWFELRTGARHDSTGAWVEAVPLYRNNLFELPLYARAGAIIPMQYVDDQTMNTSGRRRDGTTRDELRVRIFASDTPTTFTLYEDDGETVAYQTGAVRETVLRQSRDRDTATIEIGAAAGDYAGAPQTRAAVLELVGFGRITSVAIDGAPFTGWVTEAGRTTIDVPAAPVTRGRRFVLRTASP